MCVHGVRKVLAGTKMQSLLMFRNALCDGRRFSERAELVEGVAISLCEYTIKCILPFRN